MPRLLVLVLSALASFTVASCSPTYHTTQSEIRMRYVPEDDTLLFLEIEHGIQADNSVQGAVDSLRAAIDGRRLYPASGGLLSLDLDQPDVEGDTDDDPGTRDLHEFRRAVTVENCALFLDENGHLSMFRLTRVEHFARHLEIIDDWFNRSMSKDDASSPEFVPNFPYFDVESFGMYRSALAHGHHWLSVDREAILLDVPITNASAARSLAWIASEKPENTEWERKLLEHVTSLEVRDGHARLYFGEEPKRVIRFTDTSSTPYRADTTQKRLVERGVEIKSIDALKSVLAQFEFEPVASPK